MFVYTTQPVVQPVLQPAVEPVWQPVVSCKRSISITRTWNCHIPFDVVRTRPTH